MSRSLALGCVMAAACGGGAGGPYHFRPAAPGEQRFAAIGDYGNDSPHEAAVAELVKSWAPDFVITLGDNNYESGEASTIDRNIGKYYAEFIGHYQGAYGPGAKENRFWPALGNHDFYGPDGVQPYLDYFPDLPGNKRYYDVAIGRVHLFAVDSDPNYEPDGNTIGSVQESWLHERMLDATDCFKIVYFHHPPYSSGIYHNPEMRWPFKSYGADFVLAGHEHTYERIEVDGLTYLINGIGGEDEFEFPTPIPESQVRFTGDWGALLGSITQHTLTLELWTVSGVMVDSVSVTRDCGS